VEALATRGGDCERSSDSGHGMGSKLDERVEQEVDAHAFLFHELGVEYR
jgi:hypothetical protein